MSVAAELAALRTATTLIAGDALACVTLTGAGAHDLLDRVSPRQLFVRSGQMLHTVFLDDAARPVADVYLCCDDDDYFVIAEGMTGAAVCAYLGDHASGLAVELADLLGAPMASSALDGPYCWELLAEVTSPDVIGLPYLGFFHERQFTCFRAGKTGEYGYDLLVERGRLAEIASGCVEVGRRFELARDRVATTHAVASSRPASSTSGARCARGAHAGRAPAAVARDRGPHVPGLARSSSSARRTARRASHMIAADRELPIDAEVELDGERVGGDARRLRVAHPRRMARRRPARRPRRPRRARRLALRRRDARARSRRRRSTTAASTSIRSVTAGQPARPMTFPPLVRPSWS